MKPSESKAAKQPAVEKSLKAYGPLPNISTGPCNPRKTEAASRPLVNSSISGMKWGETPNDFGKGVS
jgi:hypothetical protein